MTHHTRLEFPNNPLQWRCKAIKAVAITVRSKAMKLKLGHFSGDGTLLFSFAQNLATESQVGNLEVIATFNGPMPTGVAVCHGEKLQCRRNPALAFAACLHRADWKRWPMIRGFFGRTRSPLRRTDTSLSRPTS